MSITVDKNENNNFNIKNHLALPKKFMKLRKQLEYIMYPVAILAFAIAKTMAYMEEILTHNKIHNVKHI